MDISNLLELLHDYSPEDKLKITRAYAFACRVHKGQVRKSGEEYITHPVSVACILAENHVDADTIAAGLLHDTIEDGEGVTRELIKSLFNDSIASLVHNVTKMKKLEFDNDKHMTDEANMRKIVESILIDVRSFQIKLADRLHNMRTLQYQPLKKQQEIAIETMELFVPFAGLIGAYNIKMELQDLCMMYLETLQYEHINKLRTEVKEKYKKEIREIIVTIVEALTIKGIKFDFKFYDKPIAELDKKLKIYTIDDLHDLFGLKIVVDDIKTCYEVKNIILSIYDMIEEKCKDYIVVPKTNMYEAIHLSVYGPNNRIFQFQIQTSTMYKINSSGLAAYWELIKSGTDVTAAQKMQDTVGKFQFFKVLKELEELKISNEEFNRNVKNDILARMIYVNLSDGRVIEIPEDSTILDLAYKLDDEIGNSLILGVINGEFVKEDAKLKNKDSVELVCNSKFIGPKRDVSDACVTEKAKRMIRRR